MATIEERAYEYAKIDRGVKIDVDFDFYEDALRKSEAYAYIQGATDQLKIDIDKACEAFCVESKCRNRVNLSCRQTCEKLKCFKEAISNN